MKCPSFRSIQKEFPTPVADMGGIPPDGCYCVFGAFLMATSTKRRRPHEKPFPTAWRVFDRLKRVRPDLFRTLNDKTKDDVYCCIALGIGANDNNEFDAAWSVLRKILTYKSAASFKKLRHSLRLPLV